MSTAKPKTRRRCIRAACFVLLFCISGANAPAVAAVPVAIINGRGYGHGVGMSQDGAYWMALDGSSTEEILGQFYPGTALGGGRGLVRVPVPIGEGALLSFPDGGEVRAPLDGRQEPGFPLVIPPGGNVRLVHDDGVRAVPVSPELVEGVGPRSPQLWAVPASSSTVAVTATGARYRGVLEVTAGGDGVRLVNRIDVEEYLRGMGEVRDDRWPPAALRAQAIAARTYALRAMAAGGEVCGSQRCQVYLGQQAEYPSMDAAVAASAGQVLLYGGTLATAVYSANGGGVSATPGEGFGTDAVVPYLRSAQYVTKDPDPWELRFELAELGRRLGFTSGLEAVTVGSVGPSGRALEVELRGSTGTRTVSARQFAEALGLRSTLWDLRVIDGEIPPPVPAQAGVIQVPPALLIDERANAIGQGGVGNDRPDPGAPPLSDTASGEELDSGSGSYLWSLYLLLFIVCAVGARVWRLRHQPAEARRSPVSKDSNP